MLRRIFWILSFCVLLPFQVVAANSAHTHHKPLQDSIDMPLPEKNLKLGNEFLAENKNKHGVHTLPSGLQYKVIHDGQGTSPGPTDFVTVNYRGMLTNGTEFDSSYNHNMPATFAVNAVIPGWTEVLQLMKPGSKWTVYIPPNLAYGEHGAGRLIGPNATLVFDIELLSVKPALDEISNGFNEEIDED